ncbi:MAG TPA: acyltransferase, partial [Rhodanobacteraceae bacterium]|nr:acyltransferase [Rhodanobacteraceae bacterium]
VVPLLVVALLKLLLPFAPLRRLGNRVLTAIAESWIGVNNALWRSAVNTPVQLSGDEGLRRDGHYLVLANHQSWVDILVMQKVLNRRIPLMRFFLKRQLIWVPLLGLAWWALDFPFMGRYTPKQIARNPQLAGRDIEATRRACAKFRDQPIAIMNFAEGTRYTAAKHTAQQSPWPHLLKPKAGGVAFVLNSMGDGLAAILDLSIAYPGGIPTLLDLIAGRIPEIRIHIRERPIPAELAAGDYQRDRALRVRFQQWMNGLWQDKEAELAALLHDSSAPPSNARK